MRDYARLGEGDRVATFGRYMHPQKRTAASAGKYFQLQLVEYLELRPNELIRYTDKFDDPHLPGVMQVTVTLKTVSCGTELHVLQEGIPAVIPLEMCYLGWQESLLLLAQLVEPEISG